jgi:hypothetical protein
MMGQLQRPRSRSNPPLVHVMLAEAKGFLVAIPYWSDPNPTEHALETVIQRLDKDVVASAPDSSLRI